MSAVLPLLRLTLVQLYIILQYYLSVSPVVDENKGTDNDDETDSDDDETDNEVWNAGDGKPSLDILHGTNRSDEQYSINERGLFVILITTKHRYLYRGYKWSDKDKLSYEKDRERLLSTFGLKVTDHNVVYGGYVTPDFKSADKDPSHERFAAFMERAKKRAEELKPSFLVCCILSHGFEDGSFLLSSQSECHRNCVDCVEGTGEYEHTFKDSCNARRTYDDVAKPLQQCDSLKDKPKIFIMQVCRGSKTGVVPLTKGAGGSKPKSDLFIPEFSDSLILYACAQDKTAFVRGDTGSLLVYQFCEALKAVKKSADKKKKKIRKCQKIMKKLPLEAMIRGWITDVCQFVSEAVSQDLVVQLENNQQESAYYKQQPVYWCSLRYRLSALKMMTSQADFPT